MRAFVFWEWISYTLLLIHCFWWRKLALSFLIAPRRRQRSNFFLFRAFRKIFCCKLREIFLLLSRAKFLFPNAQQFFWVKICMRLHFTFAVWLLRENCIKSNALENYLKNCFALPWSFLLCFFCGDFFTEVFLYGWI